MRWELSFLLFSFCHFSCHKTTQKRERERKRETEIWTKNENKYVTQEFARIKKSFSGWREWKRSVHVKWAEHRCRHHFHSYSFAFTCVYFPYENPKTHEGVASWWSVRSLDLASTCCWKFYDIKIYRELSFKIQKTNPHVGSKYHFNIKSTNCSI